MKQAVLLFPHQLFEEVFSLDKGNPVLLLEQDLFFRQYPFHRQKLMLHRASMKSFERRLEQEGFQVHYLESLPSRFSDRVIETIRHIGVEAVQIYEVNDDWLHRWLVRMTQKAKLSLTVQSDPHFLTSNRDFCSFAHGKKKLFFTEFYIQQRKRFKILMDEDERPRGGQWSFDTDNRKKIPKSLSIPPFKLAMETEATVEARRYVADHFPSALGDDLPLLYPSTRPEAIQWLDTFLEQRLAQFGDYEDAIRSDESFLFHSVLTPMMNIGLLSPAEVVERTLRYSDRVSLNSLEGFLRQVIGWREFVRGVYSTWGREQRTSNVWNHTRPIPNTFYNGATGIVPIDTILRRILKTGYCHHIERLMILGNFMFLCEIDPNAIYRWFMEFFVDAYDWVMVPNVYGMSQHADGGRMTTKPYLSGSSYVRRMSDFPAGEWCRVWDGLYWRMIDRHRDFFKSNPRLSMMVRQLEKMGTKIDEHRAVAEAFLAKLW